MAAPVSFGRSLAAAQTALWQRIPEKVIKRFGK
jgi:hypothetical protein